MAVSTPSHSPGSRRDTLSTSHRRLGFSIWLGYLVFVVYGSLVPLDFVPLEFGRAWVIFQHMPMYALGVESRADWIANGVLYVPLGFLTANLLQQQSARVRQAQTLFLAGLFCCVIAFGVEFAQVFFPPRTVSLNDTMAECIGSLVGLVLAANCSQRFATLLQMTTRRSEQLPRYLLGVYLLGYIAFCLFPYDILLSGAELQDKLASGNWGWLIAASNDKGLLVVLKSLAEIFLTVPFGLFLGYRSVRSPCSYTQAMILGFVLGSLIEIAQLLTATGVSQGLSVLTRTAGVCAGLALWRHRSACSEDQLARLMRRHTLLLATGYGALLLYVNGGFSLSWAGADAAAARLGELHFLPFYYHYYTSEAKALFSLASVCLMYMPIGLLCWANRGSPLTALVGALITALLIEASKLFLLGRHPDPSNIWLGALAAWGTVHLARGVAASAAQPYTANGVAAARRPPERLATPSVRSRRNWLSYGVALAVLAFAVYRAAAFPTLPVLQCILLMLCAFVVWQRPALLVAIIPAALPIYDLAPWSGRFFFEEFDLLVLVCLAVGYARAPAATRGREHIDVVFALSSTALALGLTLAVWRGLTPWRFPDVNAFNNYYSPFNALRIGKGALYAFLVFGLLRRLAAPPTDLGRLFALGISTGLTLTVAVVVWERSVFVSLFDFASGYRVTGLLSSMHTGGANIECFLASATPFLLWLVLRSTNRVNRWLGAALLLATTYALMVTFSRSGYLAFALALIIFLFFAAFRCGPWRRPSTVAAALLAAVLAVAAPVFTGRFAQERIARVGQDYLDRTSHWEDALDMRRPDLATTLFGMGLGRYPESQYLLGRNATHSGTYQLKEENGNTFLRLGPGAPIYVEQIVAIKAHKEYVLKLDVRSSRPDDRLSLFICDKWLLSSFQCIDLSVEAGHDAGRWHSVAARFSSDRLDDSPWYASKPVKITPINPAANSLIDIDNMQLESPQGENLLRNGDFSAGLDHWFFSADNHLQWHAKSLPVAVLFEQGWFGMISFSVFSLLAVARATSRAWRGELGAAAALAAFIAFLTVGLFDTLIDAPRYLLLFFLLGGFCISDRPARQPSTI